MLALAAAGRPFGTAGTLLTGAAPWYSVYATSDGRFVSVGALEPWLYAELCTRLAHPEWIGHQFNRAAWPAMRAGLAAAFGGRPLADWEAELGGSDTCFAPVLTPAEVLVDPQLAARDTFTSFETLTGETYLHVRALAHMSTTEQQLRRKPAAPGADAAVILMDLGYGPAEQQELRAAGGVGYRMSRLMLVNDLRSSRYDAAKLLAWATRSRNSVSAAASVGPTPTSSRSREVVPLASGRASVATAIH